MLCVFAVCSRVGAEESETVAEQQGAAVMEKRRAIQRSEDGGRCEPRQDLLQSSAPFRSILFTNNGSN